MRVRLIEQPEPHVVSHDGVSIPIPTQLHPPEGDVAKRTTFLEATAERSYRESWTPITQWKSGNLSEISMMQSTDNRFSVNRSLIRQLNW